MADIFDRDRDGYIDYKQFVAALKPDRSEVKNLFLKFNKFSMISGSDTQNKLLK